jgi:large subunit ribosomal protein L19
MKRTSTDSGIFHRNVTIPRIKCGDSVSVTNYLDRPSELLKIRKKNRKDPIQTFSGIVISTSASETELNAMITVRRMSTEGGVERSFLLHSPWLKSIKNLGSSSVRRAKLYYTRKSR